MMIVMPELSQQSTDATTTNSSLVSHSSFLDELLRDHTITQEQYDSIKSKSTAEGKSADEILISQGILSEEKIAEIKAKQLNIPFISLTSTSFSPQALSYLSRPVV